MTSPSCTLSPKKVEVTLRVSALTATVRAAVVVAVRKSRGDHEIVMHEVADTRIGDSSARISSTRRTTQVCGDSTDPFKYVTEPAHGTTRSRLPWIRTPASTVAQLHRRASYQHPLGTGTDANHALFHLEGNVVVDRHRNAEP